MREAALAVRRASSVPSSTSGHSAHATSGPSAWNGREAQNGNGRDADGGGEGGLASKANHLAHRIGKHLSPTGRKRSSDAESRPNMAEVGNDGVNARPVKRVRGGLISSQHEVIDVDSSEDDEGASSSLQEKVRSDSDSDVVMISSPSSQSQPQHSPSGPRTVAQGMRRKEKSGARREADALVDALDPVAIARNFRVNIGSLK